MSQANRLLGDQAVARYLAELACQREAVFARLEEIEPSRLWSRPAPGEWCIAEILDHSRAIFSSTLPMFRFSWSLLQPFARLRRDRPYAVEIDDVYHRPGFPQKVGWMWPPRVSPEQPLSLQSVKERLERMHEAVGRFYQDKPGDLLGHVNLYDPAIGWMNLIQGLQVGLFHDRLHFEHITELLEQGAV